MQLAQDGERSESPSEHLLTATLSESASKIWALIERVALDPQAAIEKLTALTEMYQRIEARDAELAFNAAKARILKKLACIKIVKSRSIPHEVARGKPQPGPDIKYAPLEEIDKHLRPLLVAEGMELSYSDQPLETGGVLVRGRLKHLPNGHYEDSFMPAPRDKSGGKSDVQAIGSTNSFLRRYIACNIFNIVVVDDDDDGAGGLIDETQAKTILGLIRKAKVGPKFLKYMRAKSIEEAGSLEAAVSSIAARDYRKAISTLAEQISKTEVSDANPS
jgi:ERF superfamily protein